MLEPVTMISVNSVSGAAGASAAIAATPSNEAPAAMPQTERRMRSLKGNWMPEDPLARYRECIMISLNFLVPTCFAKCSPHRQAQSAHPLCATQVEAANTL